MKKEVQIIIDLYKLDVLKEKLSENGLHDYATWDLRNHMVRVLVHLEDKEVRVFNHVCSQVEMHFKQQDNG